MTHNIIQFNNQLMARNIYHNIYLLYELAAYN
jgi:hypothetical protein